MTDAGDGATILFSEPGARWRSVAYGPVLCAIVLLLEVLTADQVHWFALIFCAALIAGFVVLQVIAGQRHVSVELTETTLRDGTETLPLAIIDAVLPERDEDSWDDEDWEAARSLGELSGVPRRRKPIGLRLKGGDLVQAWAKDHRGLRAVLAEALERLRGTDVIETDTSAPDDEVGLIKKVRSAEEIEPVEETATDRHSENGADR